MRRRWRWPLAERLALACLLLCGLAGAARAAGAPPVAAAQRLVLTVTLDGRAAAEPLLVRRAGGRLSMRAADLRALGIAVAGDTADVALAAVPGLRAELDDSAQTLTLTRTGGVRRVRAGGSAPEADPVPVTPGGWGAVLNYDLTASRVGRATRAAGLVDAVVHGPVGFAFGGAIVTARREPGQRRVTRLDTGFTAADPRSARRLTLGDVVTGASWQSRPVRLGGVQLATDFDLRPDLVTWPTPTITGDAAVPSTLDLIVNGGRRPAGAVEAGAFAVSDVPVQSGVNTVTVAVRDALGRETLRTMSTYVSRALLRPGLVGYSVEAGLVRTGYATDADRYGRAALSGSVRAGVSDRLTVEGHAELGGRVRLATAGATLSLGPLGLATASAGVGAGGGTELAVGYERIGRPVSVAAQYIRRNRDWRDLASASGAAARASQLSATVGFDLGRLGSLGMTLIDQGRGRVAPTTRFRAIEPPATSFATATYSVRVRERLNLVVNAGGDLRRRRSGYLSIGALMTFGNRSSAYAGGLARRGGSSGGVEVSRATLEAGDVGYRAGATGGAVDRWLGGLSYQGPAGFYAADVERINGVGAGRVTARGALVLSDGAMLAADRLDGSFAVVDARGQRGVQVYRDSRRIGVTGANGKLVVPHLRAYEASKIAIDALQLDDRMLVDRTEHWVKPALRSSVPVRFALRRGHAVRLLLVDASGAPVPAGSRAVVNGGAELPVGLEGTLYVEDTRARNHATLRLRGGGVCEASFAVPADAAPAQRIGPIVCAPARVAVR